MNDELKSREELLQEVKALRSKVERLSESDLILRALMDLVPDSIYFKDLKSCFKRVSRKLLRDMHVVDESMVQGKTDEDFFGHEVWEVSRLEELELIRSGNVIQNSVKTSKTSDGSDAWFSSHKVPVRDETGQIIGILGITRDITQSIEDEKQLQKSKENLESEIKLRTSELQRANDELKIQLHQKHMTEMALRESQERFKRIFENAYDGINIFEVDINTFDRRLVMCNDSYVRMSGYTREYLMNLPNVDSLTVNRKVFYESTVEKRRERWQKETPYQGISSWKRPDQKENYYEWTAVPWNIDGKIYIIGFDHDITERVIAENALRLSEERLRRIFDNAHDGINICEVDAKTGSRKLLMCNDSYVRMSGFTREDLLKIDNMNLYTLNRKRFYDPSDNPISERLSREITFRGISSWKRPDGEENYYEWTAVPWRQDDKYYIIGFDHDITDRLKVERELRQSEERLRTIFENAYDGIDVFEVNPDTLTRKLVMCNDSFVRMSGYSREELISCNDLAARGINHELSYEHTSENFRKILEKGESYRGVSSWIRPDRKENYYEWTAIPWKLDEKTFLIGFDHDITERVIAEKALRESEARLRRVFEYAHDGINIIELHGKDYRRKLLMCNDRFVDMSGFTREELIAIDDLNSITTVHKVFFDRSAGEFDRILEAGTPFSGISSWNRPDGRENFYEWTAVSWKMGDKLCVIGFDRDITERRKMEAEILKAHKIESIGLLAGGIAHDFNNILTAILGNISLLKVTLQSQSSAVHTLNNTEKACVQAQSLTQQLLTFAKGGAPVKSSASIEEVIRESASFNLRGSNVTCNFNVAPTLWPVEIDIGQMNQVISNLIINAKQAMPDGGTIHVDCSNMEVTEKDLGLQCLSPGKYVLVTIRDEGLGISKENLPKIFDPYFTTKQDGNGLGLATAYSIIKRHEGHMTVDSGMNQGSTFHIYIPASSKPVTRAVPVEACVKKGAGRILVVDDQDLVLEVAKTMLIHLGYTVELAKDGADAIEQYVQHMNNGSRFSLLIMDLTIPGKMGGKEALTNLLSLDPSIKAIVSSGYSNDPVMANYKQHGFKGVIVKPYKFADLASVVQQVMAEP